MSNNEEQLSAENELENTAAGNTDEQATTTEQASVSTEVQEIEKLKTQLAESNDKFLRLYSEFDNYRKRTAKEKIEFSKTAGEDIFKAILPVIDDFERALKAIDSAQDVAALKEGVDLIYNKLKNTLAQKGLEAMQATGVTFDSDLHEAITSLPATNEELKGKIVEELEKGYFLNGKVIRFAKVVVGN